MLLKGLQGLNGLEFLNGSQGRGAPTRRAPTRGVAYAAGAPTRRALLAEGRSYGEIVHVAQSYCSYNDNLFFISYFSLIFIEILKSLIFSSITKLANTLSSMNKYKIKDQSNVYLYFEIANGENPNSPAGSRSTRVTSRVHEDITVMSLNTL